MTELNKAIDIFIEEYNKTSNSTILKITNELFLEELPYFMES